MQRASLRCRTIWTPPRVSTGQKFRLPLSDEQVMDCALAEGAAIAIRAMMPKTIPRNPRIRILNPPAGIVHVAGVRSPNFVDLAIVCEGMKHGCPSQLVGLERNIVLIQRQRVFNAIGRCNLVTGSGLPSVSDLSKAAARGSCRWLEDGERSSCRSSRPTQAPAPPSHRRQTACQTLNLKKRMSPSLTTYSFPSERSRPFSLTACSLPSAKRSSEA